MASKNDPRCRGCPLEKLGAGFARTDGLGRSGVLVVAEALGEDEASAGRPLVGRAGKLWDRIVARTFSPDLKRYLERDDFLHANIINCRPPENHLVGASYEKGAIDACRPYLVETLSKFKPKAIVTLGNSALRWFTGQWGIEKLRGYIFDSEWGPVVPTYHPSYIQRGHYHLSRVVEADILKALKVAQEGRNVFDVAKHYIPRPTIEEAFNFYERWVAAGKPPLAFDIETPYGSLAKDESMTFEEDESYTILMCSFAFEPFKAISFPWIPPFIDVAKALLAEAPLTLTWNSAFDVPRLMANGVDFGGQNVDVMIAWHWLEPSLPMGLKFVATFLCPDVQAWALNKEQDFANYNCVDSDVLLRAYQEIKKRIVAQQRWEVFERHFLEFGKILTKMTKRGILVDKAVRTASREGFEAELSLAKAEAIALAPAEVCAVHPKKGYKKSKEALEKSGLWIEGRMRRIRQEVTDEEYSKLQAKSEKVPRAPKRAKEKLPVLPGDALSAPKRRGRKKKSASKQLPIFGEE